MTRANTLQGVSAPIEAKRASRCPRCPEPILVGDKIAAVKKASWNNLWLHWLCITPYERSKSGEHVRSAA